MNSLRKILSYFFSILFCFFSLSSTVLADHFVRYVHSNQTHFMRWGGTNYFPCHASEVPSDLKWEHRSKTGHPNWNHNNIPPIIDSVWYADGTKISAPPGDSSSQDQAKKQEYEKEKAQKAEEERKRTKALEDLRSQSESHSSQVKALTKETLATQKEFFEKEKADLKSIFEKSGERLDALSKKVDELKARRTEAKAKAGPQNEGDSISLDSLCFPGETPIAVRDPVTNTIASVPISSIRVGDRIVSCNLDAEPVCEEQVVESVYTRFSKDLWKVSAAGITFRATVNHPFYVVNKDEWIEAQHLQRGDQLLMTTGQIIQIDESTFDPEENQIPVYNLEVGKHHNYFACDVLVHNCKFQEKLKLNPAVALGVAVLGDAALPAFGPLGVAAAVGLGGLALHKAMNEGRENPDPAPAEEGGPSPEKPIFEPNPKHGPTQNGKANPAPKNPQQTLDASVEVSKNSSRRVGADKEAGEFNVFDEHLPGKFHGHSRKWGELTEPMKSALIKAKIVNHKGKIL